MRRRLRSRPSSICQSDLCMAVGGTFARTKALNNSAPSLAGLFVFRSLVDCPHIAPCARDATRLTPACEWAGTVMTWGEEQEKLTQETRLLLAKSRTRIPRTQEGGGSKGDLLGRDGRLETVLVKRNQLLINLGLASYGANKNVVAAAWQHSAGFVEPGRVRCGGSFYHTMRHRNSEWTLKALTLPHSRSFVSSR